jgi:zinc D-Ala-D-Ala carboxypeptidase
VEGKVAFEPRTKISEHFVWGEATRTDCRDPVIQEAQDHPDDVIAAHILWGARMLVEPARDVLGPLRVNSWYRCRQLNLLVGGSPISRHMEGLAADVVPVNLPLVEAYEALAGHQPWALDQLIFEFGRWIHIGAPRPGMAARHELLMVFDSGQYLPWDPSDRRIRAVQV